MTKLRLFAGVVSWMLVSAVSLAAQGGSPKHYAVTSDRALTVTRQVLADQGFEVVRIETHEHDQVVLYRRGNMGNGKGKGKLEKMVVRRVENRIVFVDTPTTFMVQIDMKLRF